MNALIIFSFILVVVLIGYYYRLSRIHYLTKSLYQFRESKHQVLMYIGKNGTTLDKRTYNDLINLLHFINDTIEHFSKVKSLRLGVKVVMLNTIQSDKELENEVRESEVIEPFIRSYVKGVSYSLKAVPFLRIKMFISFMRYVFHVLISLGNAKFKDKLTELDSFLKAENNYNNHNNQCLT